MRSKFLLIALGSAPWQAARRRARHARPRVWPRSTCRSSPAPTMCSTRPRPAARSRRAKPTASTAGSRASASATATRSTSTAAMPPAARDQVAAIAGRYGMLVTAGAPVTAGVVQPGAVRVVVSRRRADGSGLPQLEPAVAARLGQQSTMSNFGCGVNTQHRGDGRQSRGPAPRPRRRRRRRHRRPRREGDRAVPHEAADRQRAVCRTSARREASNERSVPGTRGSARSVHRLRLRRCDRRHAAAGCGRARLVAGEGQQGRPSQRGPVAVGLGEPEHPVRRPQRIRRSAQRHQRARGSLRAGHDRHRLGHRQRRPPVSRPRRQRHPRLSAEAVHGRPAARHASRMPR